MKCSVITIGDELLIGQVIDTNSATIARMLQPLGVSIRSKFAVSDAHHDIITALGRAASEADLIVITGGLGPTKDDVTKAALADYFGVQLIFSERNKEHIAAVLDKISAPLNDLHLRQCYLPANAVLLDNPLGTALGMWFEQDQKIYVSLPGVPGEMELILKEEVLPRLQKLVKGNHLYYRTIHTIGLGETAIAKRIEPLLKDRPDWVKLAYLPAVAQVRLRIGGEYHDPVCLHQEVDRYAGILLENLKTAILADGDSSLEREIGRRLKKNGLSLGTAESCTGGYLSHRITSVPGSSAYYLGSIIAYDSAVKVSLLDVRHDTIDRHGEVSEEVVREMAAGLSRKMNCDIAISLSGIAGPDGGTPEKPVGTLWACVKSKKNTLTRRFQLSGDRRRNIEASAIWAMALLWEMLNLENWPD